MYIFAASFVEKRLRVDDPLNAVAVHGFGGSWGVIAVGLFHHDRGLFTTGQGHQLGIQIAGLLAIISWVTLLQILTHVGFRLIGYPLRVPAHVERAGMDTEMSGGPAYYLADTKLRQEEDLHVIDDLLADDNSKKIFQRFLTSKFCPETLELHLAIADYEALCARHNETKKQAKTKAVHETYLSVSPEHEQKNTAPPMTAREFEAERAKQVQNIYNKFVRPGADRAVKLPIWTLEGISVCRNRPSDDLFMDAKLEVRSMMKKLTDEYFVGSTHFYDYMELRESQRPKPLLHCISSCWCLRDPTAVKVTVQDTVADKAVGSKLSKLLFNVLFIGSSETGKSTASRQIQSAYTKAVSVQQTKQVVQAIRRNAVTAICQLIRMAESFGYTINNVDAAVLDSLKFLENTDVYSAKDAIEISRLWQHPVIQQTYNRRTEFWLNDAAEYYLCQALRRCPGALRPV
jgi:hypothetical protein